MNSTDRSTDHLPDRRRLLKMGFLGGLVFVLLVVVHDALALFKRRVWVWC